MSVVLNGARSGVLDDGRISTYGYRHFARNNEESLCCTASHHPMISSRCS